MLLLGASLQIFMLTRPTRLKIHRGAITPIHVEGYGRVIADDLPLPTYLLNTHRRAVPQIPIFTTLAPAHSVERRYERQVAFDCRTYVARIDLDWPGEASSTPAGFEKLLAALKHSEGRLP
jgi:hypothetical protein